MIVIFVGIVALLGGSALSDYQLAQVAQVVSESAISAPPQSPPTQQFSSQPPLPATPIPEDNKDDNDRG